MSAADSVTVLRSIDGAVLTKRIGRDDDGEYLVAGYDRGFWFAVEEITAAGLVDLGQLLARLERDPSRCVIRGCLSQTTDTQRCRRLLYPLIDDHGREWEPTFAPSPRPWIGLDFDDLPTPVWNAADLARRRAAIACADSYATLASDLTEPQAAQDPNVASTRHIPGEIDLDQDGDLDPPPIDSVADWPLVCRAAASTLPPEFEGTSAWYQMTSSAGIKPGIRLRLWYWLDRPVSDDECKRWLADAPVDRALYSPVQVHYIAAPIFDPSDLDPVPVRSGWWWRHKNVVEVPELPEPEVALQTDDAAKPSRVAGADGDRRAQAYAKAALGGVATATPGERHKTLIAVAVRLYSLAHAGFLDQGDVTHDLLAAGEAPMSAVERQMRCTRQGGRPSELERSIDWARARSRAAPNLPEGFTA